MCRRRRPVCAEPCAFCEALAGFLWGDVNPFRYRFLGKREKKREDFAICQGRGSWLRSLEDFFPRCYTLFWNYQEYVLCLSCRSGTARAPVRWLSYVLMTSWKGKNCVWDGQRRTVRWFLTRCSSIKEKPKRSRSRLAHLPGTPGWNRRMLSLSGMTRERLPRTRLVPAINVVAGIGTRTVVGRVSFSAAIWEPPPGSRLHACRMLPGNSHAESRGLPHRRGL